MKLTKREEQVMSLLATGMKTAQIANCMGISARTVDTHMTNIFNKLGVQTRSGALAIFMERTLVLRRA